MDPARSSDLQEYLSKSAQRMDQQDEQVIATARAVQTLVAQVAKLSTQVQHLSSPTAPAPLPVPHSSTSTPQEPHIPAPERYGGEPDASECKWNEEAQWDVFLHGLADRVQQEIYSLDLPPTLNGLIELALRVDGRLHERAERRKPVARLEELDAAGVSGEHTVSPPFDHEPMQVGRARLSREERTHRKEKGLCLYCGGAGHFLKDCPEESVNLSNVPQEYHDLKEVFRFSGSWDHPPFFISRGAGFFFVGKKDGSLRPCIDYRGLNNITVKNTYPLPLMSSAFERLHGASLFPKLDLHNAYHLVRIREGDEWEMAFNTPRGHFEYLVMPFGLSNSPAVFQALINDVLRDMVDQFIYVYLDDILIFSSSLQEHVQHVRRVLQRLLENGLFVKAEKCIFHAQSVPFLGYIVSSEGVRMDTDKVKAVVDWPIPDSRKALQRFLGFPIFTGVLFAISAN
ncbi:uncharacterized protein LOC125255080 [Megalobrama amblycephala]|uniref:uncharacterized protein LOC125255080 n=1 Tax=Megalobrama amblycephala TaxID=75352 RepID=UPI00201448A1|nr:uncharacterized protein LOC125255080 [Megalobrama amblycephala]